jgi:hypothetical protein
MMKFITAVAGLALTASTAIAAEDFSKNLNYLLTMIIPRE